MAVTKYWLGDDVGNEGDLNIAANWSPAGVPVATDNIIVDGRSTEDMDASLDTFNNIILGSFTVRGSFDGDIGTFAVGVSHDPLIMNCSGKLEIAGSGTYRIQCGKGAADCAIAETVINSPGIVYLSSQTNEVAVNVALFTLIRFLKGTLYIQGDSEKGGADGHGGDSGCAIGTLDVLPYTTPYTVRIGDKCEDFKNTTVINLKVTGGVVTCHSVLGTVLMTGGYLYHGSSVIDMDGDDDDIAELLLTGGNFIWQPQTSGALTASPIITEAIIAGGIFDGRQILETETDDPLISSCEHYSGTVDLRNIFANFDITSYLWEGGTLKFSPGQEIAFEGGA